MKTTSPFSLFQRIALMVLVLLGMACNKQATSQDQQTFVQSHLKGQILLSQEVDSTSDYSGFRVLVAQEDGDGLDTLGFGVTDIAGNFSLDVKAPDRGVYALVISRGEGTLKVEELVVADKDTATFKVTFPMTTRSIRIHSLENAAWNALKNTKAQYNQGLVELVQQGDYQPEKIHQRVMQSSMILWSMRDTYPGTIGAELASVEAVAMLGGWDDSLAVAHAREILPENTGYVDVARIARQAQARLGGQASGVALLNDFMTQAVSDEQKAGLQSEVVIAYMDSLQTNEALAAVDQLLTQYPNSDWTPWGQRAKYELQHLMPGMLAPAFSVTTQEGTTVTRETLKGKPVILEFYSPHEASFLNELPARNGFFETLGAERIHLVSVSLEPDTLVNEAFYEDREFPGMRVILPEGSSLQQEYNIHVVPTRYLLDPEGKILGKYVGSTLSSMQQDLTAYLQAMR